MHSDIHGFIFDLDGVLVDTAKYHFQAWRQLARHLGFGLSQAQNESLKGVSRMASLDIVLGIGGIQADAVQKAAWAERKNGWYIDLISAMTPAEILPNVSAFIGAARSQGIRTAIGSASKNTPVILKGLGLAGLFDAVIDGNATSKAKPDPEVFLLAAHSLGLDPSQCLVFEDAEAGVEAALAAGMRAVGIGAPRSLAKADLVIRGFAGIMPETILAQFNLIDHGRTFA
ncbi:MAG: beta-phosphoglucomutase [Spirochaetaceae bacterium]|nr:beta-phosphoglucomutase [Spirochaetaceae bacterium]